MLDKGYAQQLDTIAYLQFYLLIFSSSSFAVLLKGLLHFSLAAQLQKIVQGSVHFVQPQLTRRHASSDEHPQRMSLRIDSGAYVIPLGRFFGTSVLLSVSLSQPKSVGHILGRPVNAENKIATCKWALKTLRKKASEVGGSV